MKPILTIILFFSGSFSFSQSNCENIDFENGDTTNWTTQGHVAMVNKGQEDPYGHFPLAVSGLHAVRLGNKISAATSGIKREITVNNTNKYFIYSYSIVFLGYPHTLEQASYVKLKVTDSQGNIIPCTELNEYAQSSVNQGFQQSTEPPEQNIGSECCYPIYYKPWTTVAIDLTPYINQTLTFELTSSWCIYQVDWGYAYVDAFCSSNLIYEFTRCDDQTHCIGTAAGFDTYHWTGPGITSGQGTSQITVNQPGHYVLDIPNNDIQCSPVHLEIDASANEIPSLPEPSFYAVNTCLGQPATFVNTSFSNLPITNCSWYFDNGTAFSQTNGVDTFETTGAHKIVLVVENEAGCIDSLTENIVINSPPTVDLGPDTELCPAYKTILTAETSAGEIHWSTGATTSEIEVIYPGTYWVTATENG